MFTRKNLYWLFMMLLVLSCVRSGCGGSSGGDVSINGNNGTTQSRDITPTPETPTTPQTPTSPDNQSTPQTPTTPNTPTTTIPFTALSGTWQASNATGSATANGTTFTMTMSTSHANTVTFSGVTSGGTLQASSQIYWDASGNGVSLTDIHDNLGSSHEMTFQNISGNTWQMYRARSSGQPEITTITFTSATTAKVERDGYYDEYQNAHYKMTYTITKQSDSTTTPDNQTTTTIPFTTLTGTWQASNGSGTAANDSINATMNMSTSHSNTVTFTSPATDGTVTVSSSQIYWNVYSNGSIFASDVHDDFGGERLLTFQNTSGNTWRMTRTRSTGYPEITTVTFTSSTAATVERDGYADEYQNAHYHMTYTITKQ